MNVNISNNYATTNPYSVSISGSSPANQTASSDIFAKRIFDWRLHKGLNNYPLDDNLPIPPIDDGNDGNTGGGTGTGGTTTLLGTPTFETVYKNLAAYPYTDEMVNYNLITRVYDIGDGLTISVLTDTTVDFVITTTLSGATPTGIDLIRTITYNTEGTNLETVYSGGI